MILEEIAKKEVTQEYISVLTEYIEFIIEDREMFCTICSPQVFDEVVKNIQQTYLCLQISINAEHAEMAVDSIQRLNEHFRTLLTSVCFGEALQTPIATLDEASAMLTLTNVVKKACTILGELSLIMLEKA